MKIVMARFGTAVNVCGKSETIVTLEPGRPGYHDGLSMSWANGFLFLDHPLFKGMKRAIPMSNVPYMDVILDEPKEEPKKQTKGK